MFVTRFFALGVLASVSFTEANVAVHSTNALKIRGGAGPLDPTMVAKANTVLQLANSILVLSPSKGAELYSMPSDPLHSFLLERLFTSLLSNSVAYYCVVFKGMGLEGAAVWSGIPWVAHAIKNLMNGKPASNKDDGIVLAICAAVFWAINSGGSIADNAVKYLGIFNILCGVLYAVAPKTAEKTWGTSMTSGAAQYIVKTTGLFMLSFGVYLYAISTGTDSSKAMGWSMISHLALVLSSLFVTKEAETFNQDKGLLSFWMIEHLITIATLAFDPKPKENIV